MLKDPPSRFCSDSIGPFSSTQFINVFSPFYGTLAGYHWQLDGRSQDEALMAAQEAAGQHRDAQGKLNLNFSIGGQVTEA